MRDVNLIEYLPQFLREYREFKEIANAENVEISALYSAAERILNNSFIDTADEYGIARLEKLLNIYPSDKDTLESRRARVKSRWFTELPYTLKAFLTRLYTLSDFGYIKVDTDFPHYKIRITTDFEQFGETEELERIVSLMMPCNIISELHNTITITSQKKNYVGGIIKSVTQIV